MTGQEHALKVTPQLAPPGAESAVYAVFVIMLMSLHCAGCWSVFVEAGRSAAERAGVMRWTAGQVPPDSAQQRTATTPGYRRAAILVVKVKVFPYSLPSVGPGADPDVQAVSPQVMWSESRRIPGSRLPLLSARPAVTSVAFTRWRYL